MKRANIKAVVKTNEGWFIKGDFAKSRPNQNNASCFGQGDFEPRGYENNGRKFINQSWRQD